MWLRQMELSQTHDFGWAVDTVLSLLASLIVLNGVVQITGFDELCSPWTLLFVSGILCMVFGALQKVQKQKLFYPVTLLALLAIMVVLKKLIINGFCIAWNRMGDCFTSSNGVAIPKLQLILQDQQTAALLAFSVFVGIAIALICIAIASLKKTVLAVFIPALMFAAMVFFNRECSALYIVAMLLTSLCLLICDGDKGAAKGFAASLNRLLPVMAICFALMLVTLIPQVQSWVTGVSQDFRQQIHILKYETEYTTLPEGKLAGFEDNKDKNQVALVVNMSQPEPVYLRGFTGAVYKNDTWTALNPEVLAENEELLYWMNQNQYNPHTQYEQAAGLIQKDSNNKDNKANTLTIQNINACSKYMYVPYNLCYGEYLDPENIGTDGIVSDGSRQYMYYLQDGGTKKIVAALTNLNSLESEAAQDYKKVENAYREFVNKNYLQIPENIKEELLPEWQKHTASYGKLEELSAYEKQECAMAFLEKIEGDSFDYATLATLTLRYYGIPARYVEGYTITQEVIDAQEDPRSINVDGNCGGAWVEVYQEGIGWLPSVLTLGINDEETNEQNQAAGTIEKPQLSDKLKEEIENPPQQQQEEPMPEGGYIAAISQSGPMQLLLVAFAIGLLVLAIVLRRLFILDRRKKRLEKENTKDAVALVFADTTGILARLGFNRGNGSMRDLVEPIRQRFDDNYAHEYKSMVQINSEAMFSSHQMDAEKLEVAEAFHHKTIELLKDESKWYKKLWMQWISCLY